MSLWALPQLLQALCAALLSKLLMRLPSNPFRQSELDLFKLQVLFWPKQVSEQSQKWFKYCAYWICYLCVWLCLEKDVCTHGTVTSPLLGELGGWIWTYLLQPGESIICCTFENWSITSRFISALFSKTNNNQTWIMLNAVCVLQFSSLNKQMKFWTGCQSVWNKLKVVGCAFPSVRQQGHVRWCSIFLKKRNFLRVSYGKFRW